MVHCIWMAGPILEPRMSYKRNKEVPLCHDGLFNEFQITVVDLLQHYLTSTSLTLANNDETVTTWRIDIPQLAQQYPFLKHGILACSALHLAHLNPSRRRSYLIAAASHQDIAMPLFRSESANVNEKNCHAVFAFAHVLAAYAFASEKEDERLLLVDTNSPDVVSNWLFFLRSGCDLVASIWECVETGPLKPLICVWEFPIEVEEGLKTQLSEHLLAVIPPKDSDDAWLDGVCQTYKDAAIEVGYAFACADFLGKSFNAWDALRTWPMRLSFEYMFLLNESHPGALIIFAHYCVLLKRLEGLWYLEGRAMRLLSHIWQRLDVRWHSYIRWPVEEIGLPWEKL
ncbi:Sterol uptake control protein [Lachnellula suecica]|uniref:Sterol uptake control protein n=1 Tax=Lachnellula suecica TaxID=602035 RepID=A0A8T9C978_9HELO|nr:Sterol uptake control protein [Lachnellula suecica]